MIRKINVLMFATSKRPFFVFVIKVLARVAIVDELNFRTHVDDDEA